MGVSGELGALGGTGESARLETLGELERRGDMRKLENQRTLPEHIFRVKLDNWYWCPQKNREASLTNTVS